MSCCEGFDRLTGATKGVYFTLGLMKTKLVIMNKYLLSILLLLVTGCAGQSHISGKSETFSPSLPVANNRAEIIVFRSQPLTPSHAPSYLYVPTLLIDGKPLGKLSQGRYVKIVAPPGSHRLSTDTDSANELPEGFGFDEINQSADTINALPGRRYYYDLSTQGKPGVKGAINIVHILTRSYEQFAVNFLKAHTGVSVELPLR